MATRALSADAGRASSGNISDFPAHTRRGVLGLTAVAGAVALGCTGAAAALPVRRPWDYRLNNFKHAAKAVADFKESTYDPSCVPLDKALGPYPPLWFDHTARSGQVARVPVVHRYAREDHPLPCYVEPARAAAQKNIDWWKRREVLFSSPAWIAIADRYDRLLDEEDRARTNLMAEPAPDSAALALKVQLALGNDEMCDADREALLADCERLVA